MSTDAASVEILKIWMDSSPSQDGRQVLQCKQLPLSGQSTGSTRIAPFRGNTSSIERLQRLICLFENQTKDVLLNKQQSINQTERTRARGGRARRRRCRVNSGVFQPRLSEMDWMDSSRSADGTRASHRIRSTGWIMDSVIAPREDTPEQTYPSNSNQLFEVTSSGDGAPIAPMQPKPRRIDSNRNMSGGFWWLINPHWEEESSREGAEEGGAKWGRGKRPLTGNEIADGNRHFVGAACANIHGHLRWSFPITGARWSVFHSNSQHGTSLNQISLLIWSHWSCNMVRRVRLAPIIRWR